MGQQMQQAGQQMQEQVIHVKDQVEVSPAMAQGPGPVMANVPPVGQGAWARINSMCHDDWEEDFANMVKLVVKS